METPGQRTAPAQAQPPAEAPAQQRLTAGAAGLQAPTGSLAFAPLSQPLLLRLKRQIDQDRQHWIIMLIAGGLCGFGGVTIWMGSLLGLLVLPLLGLLVAGVVYGAQQNYQRHYRQVLRDLLDGPMLLLLLDESYGRCIEEQRRERYRPVINQVALGEGLLERINHCAHYYKHYWRASRGLLEQPIPGMTQLSCWQDGLFAGLTGCVSGCMLILPLYALAMIRLLEEWPRVLAVKQALLEVLGGRFEPELERQYALRESAPRL